MIYYMLKCGECDREVHSPIKERTIQIALDNNWVVTDRDEAVCPYCKDCLDEDYFAGKPLPNKMIVDYCNKRIAKFIQMGILGIS